MGSISQQHLKIDGSSSKPRRRSSKDNITKNTKKNSILKNCRSKEILLGSCSSTNLCTCTLRPPQGKYIFPECATTVDETPLKQWKREEDNKYIKQALDMIQFTIQEAIDLEQLIKMSDKLSSDTVYVREVMSRLLLQLDKIETVNNKKIIQKKNEGRIFIKEKIKELVWYSKEIKRTMANNNNNQINTRDKPDECCSKSISNKYINIEQIEERRKQRQEYNKYLKLTTIKEDTEKEEICINDEKIISKPPKIIVITTFTEEEFYPCNDFVTKEEENEKNVAVLEETVSSSLSCLKKQPDLKSSSSSILNFQKLQLPQSTPLIFNPEHSLSNIQIRQTYMSSSFLLNPNLNIHLAQKPSDNNLEFKRVVGPYIIINQNVCKSTNTIQDERRSSSVTIMTKTNKQDFNQLLKCEDGDNNYGRSNIVLLPGVALEIRLLAILLLSLLVQIPLLMIICPLWS